MNATLRVDAARAGTRCSRVISFVEVDGTNVSNGVFRGRASRPVGVSAAPSVEDPMGCLCGDLSSTFSGYIDTGGNLRHTLPLMAAFCTPSM